MVPPDRRHPRDRMLAMLVDWLCIMGWVAVTVAVGVPLYVTGVTRSVSPVAVLIIGTILLVAPVTAAFAWQESGARQATVGKRARSLRVVDVTDGSRVPFGRAVVRNALKIALPWTIGHVAVFAIVGVGQSDAVPAWVWFLTVLAYALPIGYVVTLWIGTGRPPYDRAARTVVVG